MINAAPRVGIRCNLSRLSCFWAAEFTNREQQSWLNESRSVAADLPRVQPSKTKRQEKERRQKTWSLNTIWQICFIPQRAPNGWYLPRWTTSFCDGSCLGGFYLLRLLLCFVSRRFSPPTDPRMSEEPSWPEILHRSSRCSQTFPPTLFLTQSIIIVTWSSSILVCFPPVPVFNLPAHNWLQIVLLHGKK